MASESQLNERVRGSIRAFSVSLRRLQELYAEMPVQQMLAFFYIATHECCIQTDLRNALGLSAATGSRNVAALSDDHRLGKPGLGLIDIYPDSADARIKRLRLSRKGVDLCNKIASDL